MRIDVHAHYYPEEYIELLAQEDAFELSRDERGNRVFRYQEARVYTVPEPNRTADERIAEMDEAGVDVQVLSLGTPNVYVEDAAVSSSMATLTNDVFADLVRAHPGRFRALASLPLGSTDAALEELRRSLSDLALDGVQLGTNFRGEYLDSPRLEPVLAELNDASVPVLLHPVPRDDVGGGRDYGLCMAVDFPLDTTISASRLIYSGAIDRYPNISWILSHCGGTLPFLQGRLDFAYRGFPEASRAASSQPSEYMRRLYYDTVCSGHWAALECLIETVGASQVVFGTDCPHNPAGVSLDYLEQTEVLEGPSRQAVFGENALRLFPALAATR
jgi:aminocarboxymuconate-semialdehyde decarboxylase